MKLISEKDALVKSVLYEAKCLEKIADKIEPGNRHNLECHIEVISKLVDFYVNTSRFWSHKVEIKIDGARAGETNLKYAEMMNWLSDNEIAYSYNIARHQRPEYYEFSFANKDDAAAFKLRFVE